MPLFGDRGRVSSGGREKNERVGPPTDPSSPSTILKTETRTSNPSIFHLPLHTFFHPPLAFMDRGEDDTSAGVQFPSPVTTPRPSRNRNEAGPARAAPPPRVAPPLLKTKISSSSAPSWPSWPATRRKPLEIVRSLLLEGVGGSLYGSLSLSLPLSLQRIIRWLDFRWN